MFNAPLSHLFQKIKQKNPLIPTLKWGGWFFDTCYYSDIVVKAWGVFWRILSGLGFFFFFGWRS